MAEKQRRVHYLDQNTVDEQTRTARCRNCGVVSLTRHNGGWRCSIGERERKLRFPAKTDRKGRGHGLRKSESDAMKLEAGACQLCGLSGVILMIDHNHTTKVIRGVLCAGCNFSVGYLERLIRLGLLSEALAWIEK